jgi:phosphonate transport system substrate-binding protein
MMLLMAACTQEHDVSGPKYSDGKTYAGQQTYRFAVHPLHNPAKLFLVYQPLIDYLNGRIKNARLALEASRDYGDYEAKIKTLTLDFLLPNPWQTLQAMNGGYHVIAMAGDPADFKGIFIVRKDSKIKKPSDLKGKAVSYPAPTALAACIMPQSYLHEHGVNINKDIENRYVGSQESSIMNAYLGQTVIAATWSPPWRAFQKDHPKEASELKLLWETPSLINNSVMARNDLPASLKKEIRKALLVLHETPEGRAILKGMETARFFEANDGTYDVVRDFIADFEKKVRKIK